MKAVGKAGVLTLIYFEIVSTLALVIGLVVVNVVKPGAGMNVDPATLDAGAVAQYVTAGRGQSIDGRSCSASFPPPPPTPSPGPTSSRCCCSRSCSGSRCMRTARPAAPVLRVHRRLSRVLFGIVGIIMKTAPIGAFGAMAFTIGNFGVGTLAQLGTLIACFYATCALFVAVVLDAHRPVHGFSVWRFIKYIKEELFIVFGTSSSESAMPR